MSDFWKPIVGAAVFDKLNSQSNANSRLSADLGYEQTRRVMLENELKLAKMAAEHAALPTAEELIRREKIVEQEKEIASYKELLAKPMLEIAKENGNFRKTYEMQQAVFAKSIAESAALKEVLANYGMELGKTQDEVVAEIKVAKKKILVGQSEHGNNLSDDVLYYYHYEEIKQKEADERAVEIEKGWKDMKRYMFEIFKIFEECAKRREDEKAIAENDAKWQGIIEMMDRDTETEQAKGLSGEPLYRVILNRYLGYACLEGSPPYESDIKNGLTLEDGYANWYRVRELNDKLEEWITKYNANPERGILPYDKELVYSEASRIAKERRAVADRRVAMRSSVSR